MTNTTSLRNLFATAAFIATLIPQNAVSQHGSGPYSNELTAEAAIETETKDINSAVIIRKETIAASEVNLPVRVNGDLERTVELMPNGMFCATLRSVTGEPIMIGTFKDEQLSIAHGNHAFFHWTGQLESRGDYRDGMKFGVWQRYDLAGEMIAERVYEFTGVEDMLIRNEQASFAGPFQEVTDDSKERAEF